MAGLVCFYTALSSGTMGVVAPIAALGVVVPIVLGVATGEQPSAWAWVGMLVAVVGVTLASGPELTGEVSARPVVLARVRGGRLRPGPVLPRPRGADLPCSPCGGCG